MKSSVNVAVIGTGYVGLTTGACLASLGHDVVCVDVDERKIEQLRAGHMPIMEAGLEELVQAGVAAGRLRFVVGAAGVVGDRRVVMMCVPTPQAADGSANLSYLMAATAEIKDHLAPGAVVVNKSTVPVGTAERVAQALGRADVAVASNPEFLREGTAVADFLGPDRIVIGSADPAAARVVAGLYGGVEAPVMLVDARTAELIKYASNAFLATKISFANSISAISEELGANAHDVLAGVGADSRIGPQFLQPGPGWGGSCFPKDTQALMGLAASVGYEFELMQAVVRANAAQTERMVELVRRLAGGRLAGARVAVWGLSFKAGTDDTRESPALRVIAALLAAGATVAAYDPAASAPAGVIAAASALEAADGADVLAVLTEWPEFAAVSPAEVAQRLAHRRVLDTRRLLDAEAYTGFGFTMHIVGVGHLDHKRS
ncbi:MAG TPA: UDP-glucose/GDP-mannose dehydrogenase family protein [Candidatus Saccharimonadia bacterium]|nr:UDP-glucose/GDP-mannose dehydrogenase family protein [Candidatus Saccharimonadia bacterium]